jgi:hypothetical protein
MGDGRPTLARPGWKRAERHTTERERGTRLPLPVAGSGKQKRRRPAAGRVWHRATCNKNSLLVIRRIPWVYNLPYGTSCYARGQGTQRQYVLFLVRTVRGSTSGNAAGVLPSLNQITSRMRYWELGCLDAAAIYSPSLTILRPSAG